MKEKKTRKPLGRAGSLLVSLLITAVVGFVYFYVSLPAINPQSGDFYSFLLLLCVVYAVSVFVLSVKPADDNVVRTPREKLKDWFRFVKKSCLPVLILFAVVVVVAVVGQIISLPIFRASAYRQLLTVQTGDFATDVAQISFNEIPTLDRSSAEFLGDRQMGTLSDMVSQFEYSNDSTQINYQGRPVRVAPIAYADLIKWFTNRSQGLPAYVIVDMVTQEATVVRLSEGMKYSFSEPLNRNILRHLRFQFPTFLFSTPEFEIDESGHPWWVAPRVVKTIGLFGGADIQGAVLVDAVTGECTYYDQVPTWVDTLYTPSLIMQQYDFHGTLINGFINSIFGQRDVTVTTEGWNYIAIGDDVYMYTGVTSVTSDQSNIGFILSNQRTKETKFYPCAGATEYSAMASAESQVQQMRYVATFPLLLNIADQPTYFMALKGADGLVKMFAMVNVQQYDIVSTGATVAECEINYRQTLANRGLIEAGDADIDAPNTEDVLTDTASGVVADIRSAVMGGTTQYFLQLENGKDYFQLSAADVPLAVLLNVGDYVEISYYPAAGGVALSAFDVRLLEAGKEPAVNPPARIVPIVPDEETVPPELEFLENGN